MRLLIAKGALSEKRRPLHIFRFLPREQKCVCVALVKFINKQRSNAIENHQREFITIILSLIVMDITFSPTLSDLCHFAFCALLISYYIFIIYSNDLQDVQVNLFYYTASV